MSTIVEWFQSHQNIQAFSYVAGFLVAALLVELFIRRVALRLTVGTRTELDDEIVQQLRHPLATSVFFIGIHFALATFYGEGRMIMTVADAGLITLAIVFWTASALHIAAAVASRTKTDFDDEIVRLIRVPLAASVIFIGVRVVVSRLEMSEGVNYVANALLITLAVFLWSRAATHIGKGLLVAVGGRGGRYKLIEPRTMPLFQIILQTIVYLGAAYAVLLAWHVDVTAWLASAGIVGIAVGFAAKDTLANLFAGIFIIADAPYKVGDFINLDSGERGQVTNIGIRSTRILTRDDIEVTLPNAALGNAKIVNESGGPHEKERVRVNVGVAYGSDVDEVREILMDVARTSIYLSKDEVLEPRIRFRAFGDSSLDFQLMGWIDEPVLRGRALDDLNTRVYKRFNEAGIQIPFPQSDVWVRELPKA